MSSFCTAKATHIFSAKHFNIFAYHSINFNESLTNDIVSFEQMGPKFLRKTCVADTLWHCQEEMNSNEYNNISFYGELQKIFIEYFLIWSYASCHTRDVWKVLKLVAHYGSYTHHSKFD